MQVSLAISVYGIKAMRTSFAGLKQEEYMETAGYYLIFILHIFIRKCYLINLLFLPSLHRHVYTVYVVLLC